mmetsp:Transcript_42849/g.48686  ORF Transcript_42849/g.48686 Transcript_42849/m.48686 type:complete len:82 (+) Transcript_42849:257-502(+)
MIPYYHKQGGRRSVIKILLRIRKKFIRVYCVVLISRKAYNAFLIFLKAIPTAFWKSLITTKRQPQAKQLYNMRRRVHPCHK